METKTRNPFIARLRRRTRGVAMVEGAVIFPIMAGFLVIIELAHHTYDGYITAGHVARERAWSSALQGSVFGGCNDGVRDDQSYKPSYFTITGGTNQDDTKGTPQTVPNGDKISPIPGGNVSRLVIQKHFATATANVHVARGPHNYNPSPSSKTSLYCNQPWIGGLEDIIKKIFGLGGGS